MLARSLLPLLLWLPLVTWMATFTGAANAASTVVIPWIYTDETAASMHTLSPVQLYGEGGRGYLAAHSLNYDGVIACLMESADTNHDLQISVLELGTVLDRYVTASERMMSALNVDRLMHQCDRNHDHVLSFEELSQHQQAPATCLSVGQTESVASYICSRARHGDYGYAQYKQNFANIQDAVTRHQSVLAVLGRQLDDFKSEKLAPHAGRYDRVEFTNPNRGHLLGSQFEPEYIIAIALLIIIILVLWPLVGLLF